MHGAPAEANGFTHFPYVNPDARKGGRVIFGVQGSFDSLNPLIVKGDPAEGLRDYLYESLLARANDEAFTLYGLIAESVETPDDRSSVEFTLRPGSEILGWHADHRRRRDLLARAVARSRPAQSPLLLQEGHQGRADRRAQGANSPSISSGDREMPLIIGLMPVLPKHRIDPDQFEKTTLVPPIGSGPYTIAKVDPGKIDHLQARPELLGPRSSGQSRALQFR